MPDDDLREPTASERTPPDDTTDVRDRIGEALSHGPRKLYPHEVAAYADAVMAEIAPELERLRTELARVRDQRDSSRVYRDAFRQRARQAEAERDALKAAVERARKIHRPAGPYCTVCDPTYDRGDGSDGNSPDCTHHPRYCDSCRGPEWPCPTITALDTPGDRDESHGEAREGSGYHWGPDPSHGGLIKHKGPREQCSGPDCGSDDESHCPTPCDEDCDAPCHEEHQPSWKREHAPESHGDDHA